MKLPEQVYRFSLRGYVIPYVRMTTRSKWTARARAYNASQQALALQFQLAMTTQGLEKFPLGAPLGVDISFAVIKGAHKSDLDNKVKAILDAARGVVYQNDMWIDVLCARRRLDTSLPDDYTEIEIWRLNDGNS